MADGERSCHLGRLEIEAGPELLIVNPPRMLAPPGLAWKAPERSALTRGTSMLGKG